MPDPMAALTESTERLERSVTSLVAGITEQKDAISQMVAQQSEFLKLAQQQTALTQQQSNIIDRLTGQPQRVEAVDALKKAG